MQYVNCRGLLGRERRGVHARAVSFFCNDTAPTEIYTLSLHDALPISTKSILAYAPGRAELLGNHTDYNEGYRSEEHTTEIPSPCNIVCRLLLDNKTKQAKLCMPSAYCSRSTQRIPST